MENELKLKFILIPSQFLQNEEVQKKYHKSIYLSHTFHELYCGFLPYLPGSQKKHYTPPRKRMTYTSKWCNPHFFSLMMILNKKSTFGNLIESTHISQVMLFFCSQKPSSWRWMPGFLANQKTFGPEALHRKRRVPDLWPYAKLIKHQKEMVSLKYK